MPRSVAFHNRSGTAPASALSGWFACLVRRSAPAPHAGPLAPRAISFAALFVLAALTLILYGRVLQSLAGQWWSDPNYGHGFLVPFFAAYVLWRGRSRTRAAPLRPSLWGLPLLVAAIALLILGTLGAEHFTARVSLLLMISGLVVFLAGWPVLRAAAFPLGYLAFMIPLPAIVYYQLTFPLQLLASRMGAAGLVALGVPTVREGNLLVLPNCTLEVVEACSGVRSLFSLLAAVVGYGYLAEPAMWKRAALIAATVPVVIAANGLRLVSAGLLSFFLGAGADSAGVHLALGLAFFALAFASILFGHGLLRQFQGRTLAPRPSACRP
ncbi:MAG TPA: exosortase [Candidatus Acidoferrales bacterium]|nr:exosortase [Candidatus Acidoferrales bacterium]